MPDDDRALDVQLVQPRADEGREALKRTRRAAALPVPGEVEGDATDTVGEPVDDRVPAAAVEGQAVQEDDGDALARQLVGERDGARFEDWHRLLPGFVTM